MTPADPGPRPVVLVVDDEREILVAIEDLLDDYEVLATTSPLAALEMLRGRLDVSVIISDQRMPELAGNLFIARARALSDAQAILLTGYADMDAVIAAINDGGVANYVHKPWEPESLRGTVALAAERHRLGRALDVERSLFDALIDGAPEAIALTDAAGRIIRLNAAMAATAGLPREALVGRTLASVQPPPGEYHGALPPGIEVRAGPEGEPRFVRVSRVPLATGGEGGMLLTLESDVTAERVLEQRLRQAEKLQALGTLAGGIAHDFNNLLTAVIGNLDLAQRRPDSPSVGRYIANAAKSAQRGASLTRRLLSFSRQRDVTTRAVDINALLRGMDDLLHRTLGGLVTVELALAADAGYLHADPDQLELVLLNLCVNARDAMAEGGRITVTTALADPQAVQAAGLAPGRYGSVTVADEGTGMAREVLDRVFEPFFTTKPVGQGTGLGLPMTYSMARALGGAVTIDSTPGHGTRVSLLLPAADAPDAADAADDHPTLAGRPCRVLLVEDDGDVREVTRGYLEDLGHQVVCAADAAGGRALLAADGAIDLLVTDFAMPGESGLDLIAAARRLRPGLPFLLITGFADAAAIPGDVRRLAKPFTRAEFGHALAGLAGSDRTGGAAGN